jgi:6-pyruvoyltetrahydropterin/6-carboxytetrahydropterin synthase
METGWEIKMYSIAIERQFKAQHYLIGGDWGAENKIHAHQYKVEVRVKGETLDEHGYLLDIVDLEQAFEKIIACYQGRVLNDLHEFAELNPSIEHLSHILFQNLRKFINTPNIQSMRVKVWESTVAWSAYEEDW